MFVDPVDPVFPDDPGDPSEYTHGYPHPTDQPTGFEPELARGLAVALFNDPTLIQWYYLKVSSDRFAWPRNDDVDIVIRQVTHTASRNAWNGEGVDYGPTYYYDFAQIWANTDDTDQLNNDNFRVGCKSSVVEALEGWRDANEYSFKVVSLPDEITALKTFYDTPPTFTDVGGGDTITPAEWAAYGFESTHFARLDTNKDEEINQAEWDAAFPINAIYSDGTALSGLGIGTTYYILVNGATDEPLAPTVKAGESEWLDVVNWYFFTLFEAEEIGLTQADVPCYNICDEDPGIFKTKFAEDVAGGLGLDRFYGWRVIHAVGNYGELFNLLDPLPARGYNNLWNHLTEPGLIYSPAMR
jgi:general L-amino acid transport system substrate-binding protein